MPSDGCQETLHTDDHDLRAPIQLDGLSGCVEASTLVWR